MTIVLKKNFSFINRGEKGKAAKLICVFTLLIALCIPALSLSMEAGQGDRDLFSMAQANFEKGLRQDGEQRRVLMIKAAGQFQSLIQDKGIRSGYLYFNLGNAYYEAGETGKAILSYRRAQRMLPGFSDLQYNLGQARNRIGFQEPEPTWLDNVIRGLAFWHFMMDYQLRRNLFFGFFALAWILLGAMIFRRHIFLRAGLVVLVILTLGFGGSYLTSYYQLNIVKAGVVTATTAIARKGPGNSYDSFYQKPLPAGTEFTIFETNREWWKVRLSVGDEVWIRGQDAGMVQSAAAY